MIDGLFKATGVVDAVVGEDRLSRVNFVEGNGLFLDDLDGYGLGGSEVPDLVAFGSGLFQSEGDCGSVRILLGFAKVEPLRDDFAWRVPIGVSAHFQVSNPVC